MSLFDKIKEPIFLKEESTLTEQLGVLEDILKNAPPETSKKLEQEIRNVKSGILGEQQIAFELKNSHIPMYVLHDLYFEYEGLTAQIDYLVLTRRRNFVIECKNLYGNIEITAQGDFIRNISYGNKFFKERIYSPITQNERHLGLIKSIRSAERQNFLSINKPQPDYTQKYQQLLIEEVSDSLPSDSPLDSLSSELKENETDCPDGKAPDSQKPVLCPSVLTHLYLVKPYWICCHFTRRKKKAMRWHRRLMTTK